MNSLFFFYTIAMLTLCIVTAVFSFAALASTRRRLFFFSTGAFVCYAIELTEIFFHEYISQNQPFPMDEYYAISMPVLRTAVSIILNAFVWLLILNVLDKHSKRLFAWPVIVLSIANLVVIFLMPEGPVRQWLYYTLRQAFSFGTLLYAIWSYKHEASPELKAQLAKFRKPLRVVLTLVGLIILEDTLVILVMPPSDGETWLPLYLSERNFTENVLLVFAALLLLRHIYHVLSIRIQEAPEIENVPDIERHIDTIMPRYRMEHGLSEREAEVLSLVVMKKTNQEIADELVLAVGTIKSHVHNLVKKTGTKNREDLIVDFWQSQDVKLDTYHNKQVYAFTSRFCRIFLRFPSRLWPNCYAFPSGTSPCAASCSARVWAFQVVARLHSAASRVNSRGSNPDKTTKTRRES